MRVIIDRSDEPFTRQVRVWFMRGSVDGFTTYTTIGEHGGWVHTNIPTGASPHGQLRPLTLDREQMRALVAAIAESGDVPDPGVAKVLRERLDVESDRVDRLLANLIEAH